MNGGQGYASDVGSISCLVGQIHQRSQITLVKYPTQKSFFFFPNPLNRFLHIIMHQTPFILGFCFLLLSIISSTISDRNRWYYFISSTIISISAVIWEWSHSVLVCHSLGQCDRVSKTTHPYIFSTFLLYAILHELIQNRELSCDRVSEGKKQTKSWRTGEF